MTFDINAWLQEMIGPPEEQIPRHQRICYLVFANGGFEVNGWGFLRYVSGGHQLGLEQNEAIELISVGAFMDGLETAGVDVDGAFKPYFEAYLAAYSKSNDKTTD